MSHATTAQIIPYPRARRRRPAAPPAPVTGWQAARIALLIVLGLLLAVPLVILAAVWPRQG